MQVTETTPASQVGSRVRGLMAEKQVTQAEVARELGLTQPAVARRLAGSIAFDVNELTKVAALLGVATQSLMEVA